MPESIESIRGSLSWALRGKTIILAMSGGISIYRIPDVARLLIRHGANVVPFMSREASNLINPRIMEWATGNKPIIKMSGYAEHVNICGESDAVLVAPATANTIGKIANGIADTPITLCVMVALGAHIPIVIAPAMNDNMWNNPLVKSNLDSLAQLGVRIVEPVIMEEKAKLASMDEIVESVIDSLSPRDMHGMRILVTSGPTREYIDGTKYITTPSSGLTGYYMSREAASRGASVTVVSGPVDIRYPSHVTVIQVTSVLEMYEKVIEEVNKTNYDIVILAAAPLDFYVKNRIQGKIDSSIKELSIEMVQAPKIAGDIKRVSPRSFLVGYKAEVGLDREEIIRRAMKRMIEGNWDMALAHNVSNGLGFGTRQDSYIIIYRDGSIIDTGVMDKRELAKLVLNKVIQKLRDNPRHE